MKTIARNFRKNPHTATFLQTFHSAIGTNGRNYREELNVDENQAEIDLAAAEGDLLDQVADLDVVDYRTAGQTQFMEDLVARLARLDAATGKAARDYTDGMTEHGKWTAGREGNASKWIDKMIAKERALKAAAPVAQPTTTPAVEIPAGRYGVQDGEVKCYTVDYGKDGTKWAGFLFLNRISSDDRFPIRNAAEKARILDAIRADVEAASLLAALTLRICRGTMKNGQPCGRTLSDTKNPYFAQGYGPECGKSL
jgi:hypothetical protein